MAERLRFFARSLSRRLCLLVLRYGGRLKGDGSRRVPLRFDLTLPEIKDHACKRWSAKKKKDRTFFIISACCERPNFSHLGDNKDASPF